MSCSCCHVCDVLSFKHDEALVLRRLQANSAAKLHKTEANPLSLVAKMAPKKRIAIVMRRLTSYMLDR